MGNILYVFAIALILLWALGYYAFGVGAMIHVLLGIAAIVILLRALSTDKIIK